MRECGVFSELLPHHVSVEEIKRALAARTDPLGRAGVGLRRRRAQAADGAARARHPGARHLLRDAGDGARAGRPRRVGARRGVRPLGADAQGGGPAAARPAARAVVLDVAPRHRLRAAAGLHRARVVDGVAGRGARGHRPRALRHPVPPGGRPHALRQRGAQDVPRGHLRLRHGLVGGVGRRGAGRPDPRAGRRRPRHLRALRRGRLLGGGAARPQGGRRPAHLRLRRPRDDAQERERAGRRRVPRPLQGAARGGRRRGPLPRAARGRHRARDQAQDHRQRVHPGVRGGGRAPRQPQVPRAGHALLRRDRVGRRHRRGDDQVAPQRRRPARGPPVRARRAAAHALQGRGPPGRPRARAAGAARLAPAVPGPGPRDPDRRRRGQQGPPRDPARRRLRAAGRDPPGRPVPRAVAVVLRAAGRPANGRRAGRRAHLRLRRRDPRGHLRRRDDRRLGAAAVRPAGADRLADDQRDPAGQPGDAGHHSSPRARSSGNNAAARWRAIRPARRRP